MRKVQNQNRPSAWKRNKPENFVFLAFYFGYFIFLTRLIHNFSGVAGKFVGNTDPPCGIELAVSHGETQQQTRGKLEI